MSPLRRLAALPRAYSAPVLALALAGLVGGCCCRSEYSVGYGYGSAAPPAPAQRVAAIRQEIEDDGLPSQTPPLVRARKLPDNPAELFSPNYGGPAARQAAIEPRPQRERAVASAIPDDLPPDFRRRLLQQFTQRELDRLSDTAQTPVRLVVCNLYERTADVRWWAADEALVHGLESLESASLKHKEERLSLINRLYSGYLNLVVVGMNGEVLGCSRPTQFPKVVGLNLSRSFWFKKAVATTAGDQCAVDDFMHDVARDGRLAAVFAAAVRQASKVDGESIGVLGVVFDWEHQAEPSFEKR